jgi:hypothetical protein
MMKKNLFIVLSLACFSLLQAQPNPAQLKRALHEKYPDLPLEDKVIAIHFWQAADPVSRETSQAFQKTFLTYKDAKLQGGREGLLVVLIPKTGAEEITTSILEEDGLKGVLLLGRNDLSFQLSPSMNNVIYNAAGQEIKRNVAPAEVFNTIRTLVTR